MAATEEVGRILAVDLGTKRIGLALSDPLGLTAQPMPTLKAEGWETDVAAIGRIAAERGAQALVVGLPLRMSGRAGPEARRAESFAQALREKIKLPVHTWDERLTTAASERSLIEAGRSRKKRRAAVDSAASILILQSYLDTINRP